MLESPPVEDRLLIGGYLRGDAAAIGVVDGWIDVVLRENFHSLKETWDDLKQEVRIRLFRNLSRGAFNGRSSLRTYVHRIAKNVCIDFTRRASYRRETEAVSEREPAPSGGSRGEVSAWVARDFLRKILAGLSEEDRLLIRLVFDENCSYQEVAGRLGIREGTVKSRMARCKERILQRRRELTGS